MMIYTIREVGPILFLFLLKDTKTSESQLKTPSFCSEFYKMYIQHDVANEDHKQAELVRKEKC